MSNNRLKVINGNLAELASAGDFDVVIHGIHCFNYPKSGVAGALMEAFPDALEADMRTRKGDRGKMGTYSHAVCESATGKPVVIINGYTQFNYGRVHYQSKEGFDYDSFHLLFEKIARRLSGKGLRFGFPLIGGDRGNADPHRVIKVIQALLPDEDLTLVLYQEPGRRKRYSLSDFVSE